MSVRDAQVLGRPHTVRGLLLQRALSGEHTRWRERYLHLLISVKPRKSPESWLSVHNLPEVEVMILSGSRVPRHHEVRRRVVQGSYRGRRRSRHVLCSSAARLVPISLQKSFNSLSGVQSQEIQYITRHLSPSNFVQIVS